MNPISRWAGVGLIVVSLSLAPAAVAASAEKLMPPLNTWDALPALDPLHLRGPHAGERVCPMCRYGYDAGVLVLLPASTELAGIAAAANRLVALTPDADAVESAQASRFRRFLLFAGQPSPAALDAAAMPGVQVAVLDGRWLIEAERVLARPLSEQASGYVFAQRRLLWSFDPLRTEDRSLQDFAGYAMRLLADHYPKAVDALDPDLPRGLLWAAPPRFGAELSLGQGEGLVGLCLQRDSGEPVETALVELSLESERPPRLRWARTGADGCLRLSDLSSAEGRVALRAFERLQPTRAYSVNADELRQAQVRTLRAGAQAEPRHADATTLVLGPCEGCELALVGIPARVGSVARITPDGAQGEPLRIEGVVRDAQGRPAAGVLIYAYQTDAAGMYPKPSWLAREACAHGALRAWVRTDSHGRYRFDTLRPGAYPGGREPQHVHMHLIEPARCTYYVDSLQFADDPLLISSLHGTAMRPRGGNGIVMPQPASGGGWRAQRDLQLGLNIDGYRRCGRSAGVR